MENSLNAADALVRLEELLASKDVKWLVSRDGRKGRVMPYADQRAYTGRLNHIFTASGWTREYCQRRLEYWSGLVENFDRSTPLQEGRADA